MTRHRHMFPDDQALVNPANSDMTLRRTINFIGSRVTVTDDAGGDRTQIAISGGGSSVTQRRASYQGTASVAVGNGTGINLGTLQGGSAVEGDTNFLDTGLSSPSTGHIVFAEEGLYHVSFSLNKRAVGAWAACISQFMVSLYSSGAYGGRQIFGTLEKGDTSGANESVYCNLRYTEYFGIGDEVYIQSFAATGMATISSLYTETGIAKIL